MLTVLSIAFAVFCFISFGGFIGALCAAETDLKRINGFMYAWLGSAAVVVILAHLS